MSDCAPGYLKLHVTGEVERRVLKLEQLLARCTVCPRDCLNDRFENEIAACYSGRLPVVSSYTAHFGEEPALVGKHGAGNIFFGNCNSRNNFLKCSGLWSNNQAVDGCEVNKHEHHMICFIYGSSSIRKWDCLNQTTNRVSQVHTIARTLLLRQLQLVPSTKRITRRRVGDRSS